MIYLPFFIASLLHVQYIGVDDYSAVSIDKDEMIVHLERENQIKCAESMT